MKTLIDLRKEIDEIDDHILDLIAKRQEVVKKIGTYKKNNNLPIVDNKREQEKLAVLKEKAEQVGTSYLLISQIWKILYNDAYSKEQ